MSYTIFYEFYNSKYNLQIEKNIEKFQETLNEYFLDSQSKDVQDLIYKVDSFLIRNPQLSGKTRHDIITEARDNEIIKASFLKSFTRQNVSEYIQKDFIERFDDIKLELLPKSGKNSYRIDEDGIIKKGIEKKKTKSLDGILNYVEHQFFTIQKLTHDMVSDYTSGGAQNNQENDAVLNGLSLYKGETPILVILDGNYYHAPVNNGKSKIQELKEECDSANVIITDSYSIKSDLDNYFSNLKTHE